MNAPISNVNASPAPVSRAAQAPAAQSGQINKAQAQLLQKPHINYDPAEDRRSLEQALQQLNDQVQKTRQSLSFQMDKVANRFVVTVKNTSSGEVVRQIPNEVVIKLAHDIEKLKGLLQDDLA
jgi:flagellar protein FlaG